jgi:membrane protease YdiL (CAAX protease family)
MWRKLPVWLRATLTGLAVTAVPTLVWGTLAITNARLTPRVPWSAPLMAVVLWLFWRLLKDDERLRAVPLSTEVWRLALIAGGAAIAAIWAAFNALRGILPIDAPAEDLSRFPIVLIAASILMGSIVAGICEEAGFRGFMQLPLERAYGPVAAIATTSILFTLIHLSHGRAVLPMLPFYVVAAVVYGLLTFLTGSILPAVLLHIAGDIVGFTLRYIAAREGVVPAHGIALGPAVAAFVLAVAGVAAFRLLARRVPIPAVGG